MRPPKPPSTPSGVMKAFKQISAAFAIIIEIQHLAERMKGKETQYY